MRKSCESSPSRYQYYLSEKRKEEKEAEARKRVQKELQKKKDDIETLERERAVLLTSMQTAERTIEKGNIELEAITKTKDINRDKLISALAFGFLPHFYYFDF